MSTELTEMSNKIVLVHRMIATSINTFSKGVARVQMLLWCLERLRRFDREKPLVMRRAGREIEWWRWWWWWCLWLLALFVVNTVTLGDLSGSESLLLLPLGARFKVAFSVRCAVLLLSMLAILSLLLSGSNELKLVQFMIN